MKRSLQQSLFFTLFFALSKDEQAAFYKYTLAFSTNQKLLKLSEVVCSGHFSPDDFLNKSFLFSAVYGNAAFKDDLLRRLLSDAAGILKDFIAFRQLQQDQSMQQYYQLSFYRSAGLDKFFYKTAKDLKAVFSASVSQESLFREYLLNEIIYNYETDFERSDPGGLLDMAGSFDVYLAVMKLKHACSVINRQKLFSEAASISLINEVTDLVQQEKLLDFPLVKLHYYAFLIMSQPADNSSFDRLMDTLTNDCDNIAGGEQKEVLGYAVNFCIGRINAGEQLFLENLLDLYKIGLARDLLYTRGKLSPFTFSNIVKTGLRLQQQDWSKAFIEQYAQLLESEFADDFYALNLARVYFETKAFDDVVHLIHNAKFKDVLTEISTKVILLQTYYELQEFQLLDSMTDNIRRLIARKNIQSYHRKQYSDFVRFLKRLSSFNFYDVKAKNQLRNSIESEVALIEKQWFLEKLDEL